MEPGGIADEMRRIAAANPDVMKLEQIGTSTLGKPIHAIKMTEDARNVPDGTRHAILFSAVNHAREWIAAEMGRRLPGWFAEHKNDPKIRELIQTRELWFLPIQNPDGYDFTFTCGLGADAGDRATTASRTAATTTASGARRCATTTTTASTATARTASTRTATTRPSAASTRRAPATASAPRPTAARTRCRSPRTSPSTACSAASSSTANINYHSAGQLLLTPVSYTTDYYPPDSTLFDAITGTDGDEAVFPYRSQHSSDLYESNGDTIDNAYMNYGIIGWTPEMDTCATLRRARAAATSSPRRTTSPRSRRSSTRTCAFALNVDATRCRTWVARRTSTTTRASTRSRPTAGHPAQPLRRLLRRAAGRSRPRSARSSATPTSRVSVVGQNGNVTVPMTAAPAGERYGEVKGYYFERRRATFPGDDRHPRRRRPATSSTSIVKAGGLQQEFRYRDRAPTPRRTPTKKRVLVVAAEDYTGMSPNVDAPATTPRRATSTQHVAALEAAGYEVEAFDIDAPPANGGSPNPVVAAADQVPDLPRRALALRRRQLLLGRRLRPAGRRPTPTRAARRRPTAQTGSLRDGAVVAQGHARAARVRQRAAASCSSTAATSTSRSRSTSASLSATGPYTWTPDKLFGFFYPPNNEGDDDLPGTAWQRSRTISNDTWQNYLGVVGRQSGAGVTRHRSSTPRPGRARRPARSSTAWRPFTVDATAGNDPTQNADGTPLPLAKSPLRLRNWAASRPTSRCARRRCRPTTPRRRRRPTNGGAIISTRDAVTFGFGLEQVDQATRNELVSALDGAPAADHGRTPRRRRSSASSTRPNLSTATPRDPVEIELTDVRRARRHGLRRPQGRRHADPAHRGVSVPVPLHPAGLGRRQSVVKLTAEAVDAAGNKSTP